MNTIRSSNLYITPQLHRWLMWLASVQDDGKTADGIGEEMLRRAILSSFPDIEQIEAEYQKGRALLNDQAKARLTPKSDAVDIKDF